jgi:hypothetical protein
VEGFFLDQIIEDLREAYHAQKKDLVKNAHSHEDETLIVAPPVEEDEEFIDEQEVEEGYS